MIRALAFTCFVAHALEPAELTESVSLLQTAANKKKQGPQITPLVLGPPWAKPDAAAFAAMKSEGMVMVNRTALELDLTDKEPQGELPGGMRFPLAGEHEGSKVDLLITGADDYDSGKLNPKKGDVNGLYNGFARVYAKQDTSQKIKLSVVRQGTTTPLKIPLLAVSFFSLGGKGGKGGPTSPTKKFVTSVGDCNPDLVSEFWAAPNVLNKTGACGDDALLFTGTGKLKGSKGDPQSVEEVGDDHCWNSLVLKFFDAKEITLELNVGKPGGKKGVPFMFKVGLTQCDVTWEAPPTKAELKAQNKAAKAAAKAKKDAEKKAAAEAKAKAKAES